MKNMGTTNILLLCSLFVLQTQAYLTPLTPSSTHTSFTTSTIQTSTIFSPLTNQQSRGSLALSASKLPSNFKPKDDEDLLDDDDDEDENPFLQVAPKIFGVFLGSFLLTQVIEVPRFADYMPEIKPISTPKVAVMRRPFVKTTDAPAVVAEKNPLAPAATKAPAVRQLSAEEREAKEINQIKNDVEDTTKLWLNTVTGNKASTPRETVNLYAKDAVLWGTVSEQTRVSTDEIQDYFDFFAALPDLKVTSYKGNVRILDPVDKSVAANDGYYTFSFTDPENPSQKKSKKARFSFIYRKDSNGKWLIVDHHSSALPAAPSSLEQAYTVRDIPKTLETDVEDTTKLWLATVTSGRNNAWEQTSALYSRDAVLWGTVSEQVRVTPQEIEDYFKFFAQLQDLRVTSYKGNIRILDDPKNTLAANDGYYTFEFTKNENGTPTNVVKRARFSFIYRKDPRSGQWTIIDHHSSALPSAPSALKQAFRSRDINS